MPVQVGLADEEGFPRRGQIDSVDGQLDPNTGTIHCRVTIPNLDGILLPGLRAEVRLITGPPRKVLLVWEGLDSAQGGEWPMDRQRTAHRRGPHRDPGKEVRQPAGGDGGTEGRRMGRRLERRNMVRGLPVLTTPIAMPDRPLTFGSGSGR